MDLDFDLKLRDDRPWNVTKMAYDILVAYLRQPHRSVSDTVTALDLLSPGKRKLEEGERLEESTSFLLEFWRCFLEIVKQVPYDHPSQERLLELVQELKNISPSATEGAIGRKTIWTNLTELENSIQFIWKEPSEMEDRFGPFLEWVNFNSFVARLVGTDLLKKCWYFGIWAMRSSLEDTQEPVKDLVECRITTSTLWIQHSGRVLLDRLRDGDASDLNRQRNGSPLFQGEKAFSFDRWAFWKAKLDEASRLGISEVVKGAAARAVERMNEMEAE